MQKRPVILSILLTKATPYARAVSCMGCVFLTAAVSRMWCVVFMAPAVSRMGCVFQEGRMWCVVFIRGVAYVVCCIHSCMSRMWCVVFIHVCRIHGALRIVSNEKDEKDTRHMRHRCRNDREMRQDTTLKRETSMRKMRKTHEERHTTYATPLSQ